MIKIFAGLVLALLASPTPPVPQAMTCYPVYLEQDNFQCNVTLSSAPAVDTTATVSIPGGPSLPLVFAAGTNSAGITSAVRWQQVNLNGITVQAVQSNITPSGWCSMWGCAP